MSMIEQHRDPIGTLSLCLALKISKASFYRQQTRKTAIAHVVPRKRPEHALSDAEQQTVLDTLHEPHFVDLAPSQVYAQLLEQGQYRAYNHIKAVKSKFPMIRMGTKPVLYIERNKHLYAQLRK